jgi:hypothetical protein
MNIKKKFLCILHLYSAALVPRKLLLAVLGFVGTLWSFSSEAWSAGGGGLEAPCQRQSGQSGWPGGVLQGVVALRVTRYFDFFADLDVTLRLRRSNKEDFFRLLLPNVRMESPQHILCAIVDAHPLNANGYSIEQAFGISSGKVLRIDTHAIRRADFAITPGTGGILSALADVTIHYVEPEQ